MSDYLEIADASGHTLVTVPLDREITKIGKLTSSHVRLEGDDISRMHAVMERTDDGVTIIDLGSSAGTWVNDQKINKTTLQNGDVIRIGNRHLRYRTSGSPISLRGEPVEPARSGPACPRCSAALTERRWATGGGYRDGATTTFLRCGSCAICVVTGDVIRSRYDRDEERLGGTMLERDRRSSDKSCPHCPGELEHLTLGWEAVWVEIEECPRCGAVVMDDGEGALLDSLLDRSRS